MSHYNEQREADEIWEKYPDGATHYGGGTYWRQAGFYWMKYQNGDFHRVTGSDNPFGFMDYSVRPQTQTKPHQNAQDELTTESRYQRKIISLHGTKSAVDVYRVLEAFEVDSHAIAHAIKKLLAPGKRHAKTREQDLREAIKSIEAELLLMSQR